MASAPELSAALAGHPAVRRARVVDGEGGLVAYVEPAAAPGAGEVGGWRDLWSDTYRGAPAAGALDLAGWVSSYTGRPIAEREMREWVEATVGRIVALAPRRLLEIGCGTGLLLARLAPRCAEVWGTDFSAAALDRAGRALAAMGTTTPATLLEGAADDLAGLPDGRFDTVVLNSVVQYFPDLAYLRRVLAGVRRVAAPGARIFLGDLRSLPLLPAFHAAVLLQQADGAAPLASLREQLALRLAGERELLLDPALFAALARQEPDLAAVEVQVKRGLARNELTRFRYDATLTLAGGDAAPAPATPWRRLDWRAEGLSPAALLRRLAETAAAGATEAAPEPLTLSGVPNARLAAEVRTLDLLAREDAGLDTATDLQETVRRERAAGVEPEALWALGRDLPYRVAVGWGSGGLDTLDVHLSPAGLAPAPRPSPTAAGTRLDAYANRPCRPAAEALAAELARYLDAAGLPACTVLVGGAGEIPVEEAV